MVVKCELGGHQSNDKQWVHYRWWLLKQTSKQKWLKFNINKTSSKERQKKNILNNPVSYEVPSQYQIFLAYGLYLVNFVQLYINKNLIFSYIF